MLYDMRIVLMCVVLCCVVYLYCVDCVDVVIHLLCSKCKILLLLHL